MFNWIKKIFRKTKEIVKYQDCIDVENLDELYTLYLFKEMYVGRIAFVRSENKYYILTSLDYTNTDDIQKCWEEFKEKKLNGWFGEIYGPSYHSVSFRDNNGNPIDFEKTPHLKMFIAKGKNFEHKGVKNMDHIAVDLIRLPKEGNIVMDLDSVLWEVEKIENDRYSLIRKDGLKRNVTRDDIYGVVRYSWTVYKNI